MLRSLWKRFPGDPPFGLGASPTREESGSAWTQAPGWPVERTRILKPSDRLSATISSKISP